MALTGWPEIINGEGHVSVTEWSLTWIEAPIHLLCHFLYIYVVSPLHFSLFIANFQSKSYCLLPKTNVPSALFPVRVLPSPTFSVVILHCSLISNLCLKLNFIFAFLKYCMSIDYVDLLYGF